MWCLSKKVQLAKVDYTSPSIVCVGVGVKSVAAASLQRKACPPRMWLRSRSACGRSSCRSSCDASGSGGGSSCCCAHTRHGRRNFKDTNPLVSSLLAIFVWGGGSNFVGSESGQKQSVKLLQNMVYSTIQFNTPAPPTP